MHMSMSMSDAARINASLSIIIITIITCMHDGSIHGYAGTNFKFADFSDWVNVCE
jgi:hypothetical protein